MRVLQTNLHAEPLDGRQFVLQECSVEPVGGHPVADDAAGLGSLLEHGDRESFFRELGRTGEPRGTRADHRDLLGPGRLLREGLEADLPRVLDEEALDLPDGDRPHDAGGAALLLAQARRGAQHAAGAAERVVGLDVRMAPLTFRRRSLRMNVAGSVSAGQPFEHGASWQSRQRSASARAWTRPKPFSMVLNRSVTLTRSLLGPGALPTAAAAGPERPEYKGSHGICKRKNPFDRCPDADL